MKKTTLITRRVLLLPLLLLPFCAPGPSYAQMSTDVIIAVPDHFPEANGGAQALVVTEPDRSVIVFRKNRLNPHTLEAALKLADKARKEGVASGQTAIDVVTGMVVVRKKMGGARKNRLAQVIASIKKAPRSSLGSLGSGRWVQWSVDGR